MAADALDAYHHDRAAGKDSLLICDTWEMADALNRRLHDDLHRATGPPCRPRATKPSASAISSSAEATTPPSTSSPAPDIAATRRPSPQRQPLARRRHRPRPPTASPPNALTDNARVVFEGDYLREHVTLGYAVTVHSAQGVTVGGRDTAGVCHSILGEGATRAMAYVAMTRAKDENHAYIYQRLSAANPTTSTPDPSPACDIHQLRRGNKYSAAHYFRMILANDDRPRTMHAEAERTEQHLLPDTISDLLQRHEQRRAARRAVWREHSATARAHQAAYERMAAEAAQRAERSRGLDVDGLEL